jgi:hypothetical protein
MDLMGINTAGNKNIILEYSLVNLKIKGPKAIFLNYEEPL